MGYLAKQSRAEIARLTAERDTARGLCVGLEGELARMREALEQIQLEADHQIPHYAYGDSEAGSRLAGYLDSILDLSRSALCDHAPTLGHVPRPGWLTVCPTCGAEMGSEQC